MSESEKARRSYDEIVREEAAKRVDTFGKRPERDPYDLTAPIAPEDLLRQITALITQEDTRKEYVYRLLAAFWRTPPEEPAFLEGGPGLKDTPTPQKWARLLALHRDLLAVVSIPGIKKDRVNNSSHRLAAKLIGLGQESLSHTFWRRYAAEFDIKGIKLSDFPEQEDIYRRAYRQITLRSEMVPVVIARLKSHPDFQNYAPIHQAFYLQAILWVLSCEPTEDGLQVAREHRLPEELANFDRLVAPDLLARLTQLKNPNERLAAIDQIIQLILVDQASQPLRVLTKESQPAINKQSQLKAIAELPYPEITQLYQSLDSSELGVWQRRTIAPVKQLYEAATQLKKPDELDQFLHAHWPEIQAAILKAQTLTRKEVAASERIDPLISHSLLTMVFWFAKQEHKLHLPDLRDRGPVERVVVKTAGMQMLFALWQRHAPGIELFVDKFSAKKERVTSDPLLFFSVQDKSGQPYDWITVGPLSMVGQVDISGATEFSAVADPRLIQTTLTYYRLQEQYKFNASQAANKENPQESHTARLQQLVIGFFDSLLQICQQPIEVNAKRKRLANTSRNFAESIRHADLTVLSLEDKRRVLLIAYIIGANAYHTLKKLTDSLEDQTLLRRALAEPIEQYWSELSLDVKPEQRPAYYMDLLRLTIEGGESTIPQAGTDSDMIRKILLPFESLNADSKRSVVHLAPTLPPTLGAIYEDFDPDLLRQLGQIGRSKKDRQ